MATDCLNSMEAGGAQSDRCSVSVGVDAAAPDLTRRIFWLFSGLHVALWTIVPTWTQPNRPLDLVEMLYWGRSWQWGYYKHPPLPAWIAEAVFQVFGGADWPLYLVAQLAVVTTFWAAWRLSREFLEPWPALCACTILEACTYYNFMTADINNTIILQPLWALSALWLYRALTTERLRYWAAMGICLGLGMLVKYDMAILIICMLLLPIINRRARRSLGTLGPYVTVAVSGSIFCPHVIWMVENHFPTVRYIFFRAGNARSWWSHVTNPLEFLLAQLLAQLPMLAIAWPLWRRRARLSAVPIELDQLQRDFLLVICCAPLLLDLVLSAMSGIKIQSMWGGPLWTFSGLFLLVTLGTSAPVIVYRSIVFRSALVGCVFVVALGVRTTVLPHFRAKPSRIHFPGQELAEVVERQWRQHSELPLSVIAGPWWPAANAGIYSTGNVQIYDFVYPALSPWADDASLRERGGVIVWEHDSEGAKCANQVRRRFPDAELLPPVELNWQTTAPFPPVRFGMAIVQPGSVASGGQSHPVRRR